MGKSTIPVAIFNSYVKLPEGNLKRAYAAKSWYSTILSTECISEHLDSFNPKFNQTPSCFRSYLSSGPTSNCCDYHPILLVPDLLQDSHNNPHDILHYPHSYPIKSI